MKFFATLFAGILPCLLFAQTGGSGDPFTSLDQAAAAKTAGTYYFNLGGTSFNTHVDANGYVMIAIDFGNGSGNLPQGTSLTTSSRGIFNTTVLAALTGIQEVRISSGSATMDVVTTNATIIARIQSNSTLSKGVADNAINDYWTGTNSAALTVNAGCTTPAGTTLNANIFHPCGATAGMHWIPVNGTQRLTSASGEVADAEYFQLWVKGSYSDKTGPAGVEAADGSSDLQLWLKADAGTSSTTDGGAISQWNDQSGYGVNVSQATGSKQPTYENDGTNALNGNPVVHFDGADELISSASTSLNIDNDFTIFLVKNDNTTQPAANSSYFCLNTVSGEGIRVYRDNTNDKFIAKASGNYTEDYIYTSGVTNNATYIGEYKRSGTTMYMSRFGGSYFTDIGTTGPIEFGTTPQVQIGYDDGLWYLQGNIAEVIAFNRAVNTAEKIILENYLAAKYGASLSSNDVYTQDNSGNGNYDHDVAGIGRVDASNIQDDAQGSGIIRILNPGGLGDNEFLMWGHDNGTLQATETSDINTGDGVQARLARVWRVSEVNSSGTAVDVGSVDIRFDLSGLGNITASDLRLIVDTDNDGNFADETAISGAVARVNNVYAFEGVTALSNGLRFTLGTINTSQTPLPIELVSFNAEAVSTHTVELNWETAVEINNDYFTVERSSDGINWNAISVVSGAGNSQESQFYNETDRTAPDGLSYYRLKQTDFNDASTYSEIRTVDLDASTDELRVYPNPTSNSLHVSDPKCTSFTIFNLSGQMVSEGSMNGPVDVRILPSGMYILEVSGETVARVLFRKE